VSPLLGLGAWAAVCGDLMLLRACPCRRSLTDTGAKALVYVPTVGSQDNTEVLKSLLPELATCECLGPRSLARSCMP
jgi:hypothetical protein